MNRMMGHTSPLRIAIRTAAIMAVASCGRDRSAAPDRGGAPQPAPEQGQEEPVVGGPCTYAPLSFTVIVDSVLANGDVILQAADSVPWAAGFCPLRPESDGRVRASRSIAGERAPGDTLVIEGQVIESGTCTPCAIGMRPVRGR